MIVVVSVNHQDCCYSVDKPSLQWHYNVIIVLINHRYIFIIMYVYHRYNILIMYVKYWYNVVILSISHWHNAVIILIDNQKNFFTSNTRKVYIYGDLVRLLIISLVGFVFFFYCIVNDFQICFESQIGYLIISKFGIHLS